MSPRTNWLRFTTLLSARIINGHLRDLTSENRDDCFVIDDSLYERTGFKRTELASRVFDHVSMRFKKGFRLLTLGLLAGRQDSFVHGGRNYEHIALLAEA